MAERAAQRPAKRARVRVPATIANIGSGFDCIGLAVDLWNSVTVERGAFAMDIVGRNGAGLPKDATNLLATGALMAFRKLGVDEEDAPALRYKAAQNIPVGSGLGSSSAALVAGILAGAAIIGATLSNDEIIQIAADAEGHADNIAPALLGGGVIGIRDESRWLVAPVNLPNDLTAVVFCPEQEVNTNASRAALPERVAMSDAVYNLGRGMMLVNALNTGDFDALRYAAQDKLHQPYRESGIKGMKGIMRAALNGGALCSFLAGSGPTIAALTIENQMTIAYEMSEAARQAGVKGESMVLRCTREGARVEERDE